MVKYVLFDLDGTLTDPAQGITNAIKYALTCKEITPPSYDQLCRFIGPPLFDTFENFFGMSHEEAAESITLFREYFSETGIFENRAYDGIGNVLTELKARGYILAVATSKPRPFALRILEKYQLLQYFDFVGGSEFDGTRDAKCDVIKWVLKNLNINDPNDVIMVGDREHDVNGAKMCGVSCVGVSFGYGTREELLAAGAVAVAESPEDLLAIL